MILTALEIYHLAVAAGVSGSPPEHDVSGEEFNIIRCPAEGLCDHPAGPREHYRFVAYSLECAEEGCMGLGEQIETDKYARDAANWRVSNSGYSIKTGWGDDKKIITAYPGKAVPLDEETYVEWLENAEKICGLHNNYANGA